MTGRPTILVVDDEQSYRDALAVALEREGFDVVLAADGAEALERFDATHPQLVLLDVMLPKMSGIDVCREIRTRSRVPIIMVTARNAEIDAVVGLEVGADDYVTKPFRLRELVARVRAGLRRSPADDEIASNSSEQLEVGDVRLDVARHEVFVRDELVALPLKEFELLELLAHQRRPGADPRRAHRPDLGTELLRRHQDARRARETPPGEDRSRSCEPGTHRHRPRRRLPLREEPRDVADRFVASGSRSSTTSVEPASSAASSKTAGSTAGVPATAERDPVRSAWRARPRGRRAGRVHCPVVVRRRARMASGPAVRERTLREPTVREQVPATRVRR